MPNPNVGLNGKIYYVPGKPQIYWIDNGLARLIPDEATYHGVFGGSPNKVAYSSLLTDVTAGPPIADGTELVRAGNDAKIYLVEKQKKRWIPSETIKAQFQLNGTVHSLPAATVNGFANGPDFVDPNLNPGPRVPAPGPGKGTQPGPSDPGPNPGGGGGGSDIDGDEDGGSVHVNVVRKMP
jgi:hypothetical protein